MVTNKIDTKTRILEGAKYLFFSTGARYLTMEGVASHVGVSKRTLYKYFSSRDDLINAIVDSLFERILQLFSKTMEKEKNPVKQMNQVLASIAELSGSLPMDRLLEIKTQYPHTWIRIEKFRKERIREWYRIFSEGQKKGYFRSDIDMNIMSKVHIQTLNSIFNPEFYIENQVTAKEAFKTWIKMLSTGLLTAKGKKYDTTI